MLLWSWLMACTPAPAPEGAAEDSAAAGGSPVTDGFELEPVSACEDPLPSPIYEEVGEAWNLLAEVPLDQRYGHQDGAGLAAADIDGDGLTDLLLTRMPGEMHLMLRRGDRFEAQAVPMPSGNGALWLDVDQDGRLDLLIGGPMAFMLRADGGGNYRFEPFPDLDGTGGGVVPVSVVHDMSPGDFDLDGRIELFMARTADIHDEGEVQNDRVVHVDPDGFRVEPDAVPEAVGLRHGYDATSFDADGDGDIDVYLANDLGMNFGGSTLLRNEGGRFVDATDDCFCSSPIAAKGVDVADFDGDGQPDLFLSGSPLNTLFGRDPSGGWVDVSATSGAQVGSEGVTGWGGIFIDYDNDGQRDLLAAQGDRWNEGDSWRAVDVPLLVLRQDEGQFTDVSQEIGLTALGSFRATIALDFNADGVEDLLISQVEDRPLLYLSQGCTDQAWVEVDAPVGSAVRVTAGDTVQTDWVTQDSGFIATTLPRVHLGLGENEVIDEIRITLPGGEERVATGPIAARRRVRLLP